MHVIRSTSRLFQRVSFERALPIAVIQPLREYVVEVSEALEFSNIIKAFFRLLVSHEDLT